MEREKALDMALGQIEKQFGKGAVMRMNEEAKVKIASIPTGALSLDLALGIGGLPRGRVVEVYGPESSGKCLTAGTYVWTDQGMETVEELFARVGQKASCTSRVTDVTDAGVRLVNEQSELELMAAVTHNHRKPVWRVQLESGRHVEATENHPLRVLNERGRIVWRTVGELQEGDVLVSALFGAETAVGGSDLSEDEAVLLGYLVSEGTLGESNHNSVTFTNAHDPDVLDEYCELMEHVLGVDPAHIRTYTTMNHRLHDTAVRRRLADDYGLNFVGSAAKEIPHAVRTGGAKIQRAFLSALYEGDGWIEQGPKIGYTSASRTLAEQVQLLLLGLGIPASLRTRHHDELDRDYHTVLVPPGAAARFLEQVGFRSERRAQQVAHHLRDSAPNTRLEHIPYMKHLLLDLRDALGGDRELDKLIHDVTRHDLTGRADGSIDCSPTRLLKVLEWIEGKYVPASARPLVAQLHELAARPLTYERVTAVVPMGEQPTFDVVLPQTHSFLANGVLSHNTTVALHAIAEAQKAGGIAAFIDAEHALDPSYAAALGVDIEGLLVSQPDTGEQALEITDMLIRSNAIDIVVIDSVAALTPRAEIEGEMGDAHVGLQARLMSQALRKLAGTLHRSKTCALFVNQIRERVGVMFGCMSYATRVTLADGSQEKIGKIVNQRLPVEVLSYDPEDGRVVPRKVTNWFDNGPTEEFLSLTVARGGGSGRSQFTCTPNHQIRTPGGWREAQELAVGDRVLQTVEHHLSEFQWEVILGGLMGDGALSPTRSGHGARYRFGHGRKQAEYADWKASLLDNIGSSRGTNDKGAVFYDFRPLPELAELRRAVYLAGKKVLSDDYLKRLTPLALAIWYMDDAGFRIRSQGVQARTEGGSGRAEACVEALDPGSRRRLQEHLRDEWGIDSRLSLRGGKAVLQFPTAETDKLQELIAPYVHPSMDYKLLPRHRGKFAVEPVFAEPRWQLAPMPVVSIESKTRPADGRPAHRYDLEVDGTHNYFVDRVMVHNSPETQPGGRALKFYSSVRLDVRRIESLKDGTDFVGNRVRVKVVKNKCVAEGTRIFDPTTGLTHRIEDVVDRGEGTAVWAADKAGRLHVRPIGARMNQGEQEVIGLRLVGGALLRATRDHRILTEHGWREAGDLAVGDRVARPLKAGTFGEQETVTPAQARALGAAINGEARVAGPPGERISSACFGPEASADVVGNLLAGLWETSGRVHSDRRAGIRCELTTTSEQLAWQVHWLLLRFGIASTVAASTRRPTHEPNANPITGTPRRWRVTVAGIDNVRRFATALPLSGSWGGELETALATPTRRHHGSTSKLLSAAHTEPVLDHLAKQGLTASEAARLVEGGSPEAGMRGVLGKRRLRRDRVARLAEALDSAFLREVLSEELYYERIVAILPPERARTFDIEVAELHNFVADDVVVHNCAPPFKQAEFDILFGEGISREGSVLDVGVDEGIVKKAGAWYTYDGEQLGQGREKARQFLKEHDEVTAEIYKKVTEALGLVPTDVTGDESAEPIGDEAAEPSGDK